jgi:hypothetical protein
MNRHPYALCFIISIVFTCALMWPLPLGLNTHFTPSAYGLTHAWSADYLFQSLTSGTNPHSISSLGYPWIRQAQFIGWGPAIASWPFRGLLGPLAAFQLILLLSLPVSAFTAGKFIQSTSQCGPKIAAPAGLLFAFSPYALATLQTGEVPKLQLWLIPLFGLALLATQHLGSKKTLYLAAVCLITSFTSPYYGLAFPLLAGMAALVYWRRKQVRTGFAVLVGCGVGLLPALFYYRNAPSGSDSFYRPALSTPKLDSLLPSPHPVASVRDLLLGTADTSASAWDAVHESALGIALLLACGAVFWSSRKNKRKGRSLGVALVFFGILLAVGPQLAFAQHKSSIPMPAKILEFLHYPLEAGGMYYRMVPFAMLGLALILASSLPHSRRGVGLIWLIVGLQSADALRHTGPWPRPTQRVAALDFLKSIQGQDGAILTTPIVASRAPGSAQRAALRQMFHKRPETALPSDMHSYEIHRLQNLLNKALRTDDPGKQLRAEGFRFVFYQPEKGRADHRVERDLLIRKLGKPIQQAGFLAWDLGTTTLKPRPFEPQ